MNNLEFSIEYHQITAPESQITNDARDAIQGFVTKVAGKHRDHLDAIILFGGLVRDSCIMPGWSDIDMLVILDVMDMEITRDLAILSSQIEADHGVRIDLTLLYRTDLADQIVKRSVVDGASMNALLWPGEVSVVLFGVPPHISFSPEQIEEVQLRYISFALAACRDYQLTTLFRSNEGQHLRDCIPRLARWTFSIVRASLRLFGVWTHPYDASIIEIERLFPEVDTGPLWSLAHVRRSFLEFPTADAPTMVTMAILFIESYVPFILRQHHEQLQNAHQ